MRTLLFSALLLPVLTFGQRSDSYLKINDAGNKQIVGTATTRGFENAIIITSLLSDAQTAKAGAKMNSQMTLNIPVAGASAELRRALSLGQQLPKADITVTTTTASTGRALVSYTIRLEAITLLAVNDAVGCNGVMNTTVVLSAGRIGWTYYAPDRSGTNTMTRKFGWDFQASREWTGF